MLLLGSCKTKQKLITEPSPGMETKELIHRLLDQPEYEFISGKAKINVASPYGSTRATLYLRTIKDSVIWMAVKKLSVEGGRVLITPDSLFLILRQEKAYQKYALADINKTYGLNGDFSYIQNLILGLTPEIDTTKYWEVNETSANVEVKTSIKNILHKFIIDRISGNVTSGTFKDQFVADGGWQYDNYIFSIDSVAVPAKRTYKIQLSKEPETQTLKIDFSELEVDVPKSIRFDIPSHYTRTN